MLFSRLWLRIYDEFHFSSSSDFLYIMNTYFLLFYHHPSLSPFFDIKFLNSWFIFFFPSIFEQYFLAIELNSIICNFSLENVILGKLQYKKPPRSVEAGIAILKQRKYKYTLNKIQKILQKSSQPSYYGADVQLTLRELQLSAINKLIQRNIAKKYKYSFGLVEYLIELAYRNLDYCQQMLRQAVKERTFFSRLSCGSDLTLTINSQTYSVDDNCPKVQKMRNASINMNTGIQNEQKLKEHLMNYFQLCT